jgi:hypothetical protein
MQLGLLKLNAGIGRALERAAQLQRDNTALAIENSEIAAGNRVEAQATRVGMQIAPPGALRFLTADPARDLGRAATALSSPPSTPATVASSPSTAAASSGTEATTPVQPSEAPTSTQPSEAPATQPTEATTAAQPPEAPATQPSEAVTPTHSTEAATPTESRESPASEGASPRR